MPLKPAESPRVASIDRDFRRVIRTLPIEDTDAILKQWERFQLWDEGFGDILSEADALNIKENDAWLDTHGYQVTEYSARGNSSFYSFSYGEYDFDAYARRQMKSWLAHRVKVTPKNNAEREILVEGVLEMLDEAMNQKMSVQELRALSLDWSDLTIHVREKWQGHVIAVIPGDDEGNVVCRVCHAKGYCDFAVSKASEILENFS